MKLNKKKTIVVISILILFIIIIFCVIKSVTKKNEKIEYNYFLLSINEKVGIINKKGEIVIDVKYDNIVIPNPGKDVFICTNYDGQNEKTEIINEKTQNIFKGYDYILPVKIENENLYQGYETNTLIYKQNEKYGLINLAEKKITKPIYDEISGLKNKQGEFLVKKDGKYGVIDKDGKSIIETKYDMIMADGYFVDYQKSGYIVNIKTDNGYRYGYINYKGKTLLNTEYNYIERMAEIEDTKNIYLIAKKNGRCGVIKNEDILIDFEYQSINYDIENKVILVEKNEKYGAFDFLGNKKIEPEYDTIYFIGKYTYAIKDDKEYIYDENINYVENPQTTIMSIEDEKYFINIDNNELYGVLDKDKNVLIENEYLHLKYLYNGYFIATNKDYKMGIIDEKGNEKVEFNFGSIQKYEQCNLILAKDFETSTICIYNEKLEEKIRKENAQIYIENGYSIIYSNQERTYLNNSGEIVSSKEILKNNKLFAKTENGKSGFVDKNDKIKINFEYDEVTEFNEYGFAGVKVDGKWGVINENGKVIITPQYELTMNIDEIEFLGKYYKLENNMGIVYYTID